MDRKRLLIWVAVGVGLVVLIGVGVAVAAAWPMISGEQVAAGPAPSEEELAAASLTQPVAAEEPPPAAPLKAAGVTAAPADLKADSEAASIIAGHWVCIQGNDLQPEGSEYYFTPSEDDEGAGTLLYYDDPNLDPALEDSWVTADYTLDEDGVLTISSGSVGFVSEEYEVGFKEDGNAGRTYQFMGMASLAEDAEEMDPALLFKLQAIDPAWDEWVPEGLAADAYAWADEDEFAVAQELVAANYPELETWAALIEAGDPEDEAYAGDRYIVYAGVSEAGVSVAMTFYVATDPDTDPVWLGDEGEVPEGFEAAEAEDGTAYLWDPESLAPLQEPEAWAVDVLSWACWDFTGGFAYAVEGDEEAATVSITKWDAYPVLPDGGFFEAAYSYNEDGWWDLEESAGP